MEDEENLGVDLEHLRSFVSDEIFEFLSAPSTSATAETFDSAQHAATNDDPYPALEPHLSLEAEVDRLLLECHLQYDESLEQPSIPEISTAPPPPPPKRHFAVPKTDQEIAKAKEAAIPHKTIADTNYCVGLWNQWSVMSPGKIWRVVRKVHWGCTFRFADTACIKILNLSSQYIILII
jgi:hypothetical protein